ARLVRLPALPGGAPPRRPGRAEDRGVSIRVNGREIADAEVLAEMQYHPASSRAAAERAAAEALVLRELLLQEAVAQGLAPEATGDEDDAVESAIGRLIDRNVITPEADEESCRRYFEANRRKFRTPDLCEAQHILIASPPNDVEARATAEAKARTLIAELLI